MKQRIVVLSNKSSEGQSIKQQLDSLFDDIFQVDCYSLETPINQLILADLVLSTNYQATGKIVANLSPSTSVYVLRRTFMRTGFERVMRIPHGAKILVAGENDEAKITAATLCELGAKHLQYIFEEDVERDTVIDYALVANLKVPVKVPVRHVIEIGERVVDPYGLFDILAKMHQLNPQNRDRIAAHMNDLMPRSDGFMQMNGNLEKDRHVIEQIIDVVSEGVVIYDSRQQIVRVNRRARQILASLAVDYAGKTLEQIFAAPGLERIAAESTLHDEEFQIGRQSYLLDKVEIDENDAGTGGALVLREITEIQRLEVKIRQNNVRSGHVAKYHFSDIVGSSREMQTCLNLAKRMAASNVGILIEGETGTGKELFAQAIHNLSPRHDKPFVAFNCAAVPETLLSGELFGYEEGAFTGAKKGGHRGLFERAHTGTIFLDEIGDISPNMQASLLRVLQERQIIRVGGTAIIPIDVRVIAATNQTLLQMVEEGKFRRDLYYRLNIMTLKLPPLRNRREDIPELMESMLRQEGSERDIPGEIYEILQNYRWPGNVRELQNCITYLCAITSGRFTIEDLPAALRQEKEKRSTAETTEQELERLVLEELRRKGRGMGRRMLCENLNRCGIPVPEGRMKLILHRLEQQELLEIAKGRGGTVITEKGCRFLEQTTH